MIYRRVASVNRSADTQVHRYRTDEPATQPVEKAAWRL